MGDLLVGALSFAAGVALGAGIVYLVVVRGPHQGAVRAREEQRRQWRRERLFSSLETLDLAMATLTTAAFQGAERLAQERATGLAQLTNAVNRSGDDELRRLVEVVVERCDALGAAGRGAQGFDRLVQQLGDSQRDVYRRMEVLLDQTFD